MTFLWECIFYIHMILVSKFLYIVFIFLQYPILWLNQYILFAQPFFSVEYPNLLFFILPGILAMILFYHLGPAIQSLLLIFSCPYTITELYPVIIRDQCRSLDKFHVQQFSWLFSIWKEKVWQQLHICNFLISTLLTL